MNSTSTWPVQGKSVPVHVQYKAIADKKFTVFFDGGDSGKLAYGSWKVVFNGFEKKVSRFKVEPLESRYFGLGYEPLRATMNVAEYMSLIKALEWLQSVQDKDTYTVDIYGDSMLVVRQVQGKWRCKSPHLRPFIDRARSLLKDFEDWNITWHRRTNSVAIFGH